MTTYPRLQLWLSLAAILFGIAGLICMAGCAASSRDLIVETPDGLKASLHTRDVFEQTKVFLRASKTATGWKLEYGRESDPDAEAIRASGGIAADVTRAAIDAAVKAAAKSAIP